jgi:hypothetical protein
MDARYRMLSHPKVPKLSVFPLIPDHFVAFRVDCHRLQMTEQREIVRGKQPTELHNLE